MPPEAGICEVGWTDVMHNRVGAAFSHLTDPGTPITLEAISVHHITNEEVASQPPATQILGEIIGADVFAAHNADFEKEFWNPPGSVWIDTYKVALRTHPEAPRHSNQFLRYYLGLSIGNRALASPPHRAGPDAYVTAHILVELMKYASIEEMIRWSSGPALLPRMPIGKYRGRPWSELDTPYLKWIVISSDMDATIKANANHELKGRGR